MRLVFRHQSELKASSDRRVSRRGCNYSQLTPGQPRHNSISGSAWFLITVLLCLALATPARLSGQEVQASGAWPSEQQKKEAEEHARILWSKILTRCGDSYYYTGSGLDNLTMTGQPFPFSSGPDANITEFRDVTFDVHPSGAVSTADEMNAAGNGMEEAETTSLLSMVYRVGNTTSGTWSNFLEGPLSPLSDIAVARAAVNPAVPGSTAGHLIPPLAGFAGAAGVITVHMQKKNGQWSYSLGGFMGYITRSEADLMASDDDGPSHEPIVTAHDAAVRMAYRSNGAPIHRVTCAVAQQVKETVNKSPDASSTGPGGSSHAHGPAKFPDGPPSVAVPSHAELPDGCGHEAGMHSMDGATPAKLKFVNETKSARKIYWLSYTGKRTLYSTLAAGASAIQSTFVTRPWVVTDANDKCIAVFLPPPGTSTATIDR